MQGGPCSTLSALGRIQGALKSGAAACGAAVEVEAWVRHARVAARIAFVDVMDDFGENALQTVLAQGTFCGSAAFDGLGLAAEAETAAETAERSSLAAFAALCKPGAKVRLRGVPDAGAFGEPMLKVARISLLVAAPCSHAGARLLHEVHRGVLPNEEAAVALGLAGGAAELLALIGQCGAVLGSPYPQLRHAAPQAVQTLEGAARQLRKALPAKVGAKIFREQPEFPDSAWLPACAPMAVAAVTAALDQSMGDVAAERLRTLEMRVQARRRFAGDIAVLSLMDKDAESHGGGEDGGNASAELLHAVLHPGIFGARLATDGAQRLRMYTDLCCPGSSVRFSGLLAADVCESQTPVDVPGSWMYATDATLLTCCPQLKALRCAVDFAASGQLPSDEVVFALALPDADAAAELVGLDETGRAWAAADAVQRLQSVAGTTAQVGLQRKQCSKDSSRLMEALSSLAMVRERWPAEEEPVPERELGTAVPEEAGFVASTCDEIGHVQPPPQAVSGQRTLPVGRAGSRWTKKKRPQIDWVTAVVESLLDRHPSASSRPLRVLDVGGGQGLLASHVAERIGAKRVVVTVLEIGELHASKGERRVAKQQLENVYFKVGDASSTCLDEPEERPDVVMALHACGALSDVALGIAARHGASFCICQCCFKSNPNLQIGGASAAQWLSASPTDVALTLEAAATVGDAGTATLGMHTVSALRAEAVLRHWRPSEAAGADGPPALRVARFPARYSPCNFCLVGEAVQGKTLR